jgi:ribosomal protein L40E
MAAVDLHLHEVEDGWMPPVCARCGAESLYVRAKTTVWSPWWVPLVAMVTGFVIFLPFIRLLFAGLTGTSETSRRVTLHLPFCDRHRNHWRWRFWPLAGLFMLSLGLIGGGITVATQWEPTSDLAVKMIGMGVLCFVVWGLLALILPRTGIRMTDMAGTALTLAGVSELFCDAVAERRLQQPIGTEAIPKRTCTACGGLSPAAAPKCYHCGQASFVR